METGLFVETAFKVTMTARAVWGRDGQGLASLAEPHGLPEQAHRMPGAQASSGKDIPLS